MKQIGSVQHVVKEQQRIPGPHYFTERSGTERTSSGYYLTERNRGGMGKSAL